MLDTRKEVSKGVEIPRPKIAKRYGFHTRLDTRTKGLRARDRDRGEASIESRWRRRRKRISHEARDNAR